MLSTDFRTRLDRASRLLHGRTYWLRGRNQSAPGSKPVSRGVSWSFWYSTYSSLLLDPTGLAPILASEVVEKPQEVDESFPLARPACGVPGVSAAVPNDSSRWGREWSLLFGRAKMGSGIVFVDSHFVQMDFNFVPWLFRFVNEFSAFEG